MCKVISGVFDNNQVVKCSKCGKAAVHHYELNRGYGSQFDSRQFCEETYHVATFDLCEDCNEDWVEDVVNETPIADGSYLIYPNEHKLVEFIATFPEFSQDMVYYGCDKTESQDTINEQYQTYTYVTENGNEEKAEVDYDKIYLEAFGSEEEIKKAFEEMAYTSIYEEDILSNE